VGASRTADSTPSGHGTVLSLSLSLSLLAVCPVAAFGQTGDGECAGFGANEVSIETGVSGGYLTVYDMAGTPLVPTDMGDNGDPPPTPGWPHGDGVSDTLYVAPRASYCDLFIDFATDGGGDFAIRYENIPVIIEVSTPEKEPENRTYTRYAFTTTADSSTEPVSFFRPNGGANIGPDLRLHLLPSGVTYARPASSSRYVNDALGNMSWVIPYDWAWHCAQTGVTCGTSSSAFLAPIQEIPGATGPTFTFAEGADTPIASSVTTTWAVEGMTLRYHEDRRLLIRGSVVASGISFTAADVQDPWGGIVLEAGSATLTNTVVEHADIGVTVYDPAWLHTDGSTFQHNRIGIDVLSPLDTGNQNRFEATTFNSNGVAIRSDFAECVGMTCSCFGACRSGFSVTNSCVLSSVFDAVSGSPGHGIWAANTDARIVGTTVLENDAIGLLAENASVRVGDTRIATNGAGTSPASDGAQGGADAELQFFDAFDDQIGGNAIHQNAAHEVAGLPSSFVVVGTAYHPVDPPPANSVWKTSAPASGARYVFNGDNSYTLAAEHVYWNSSSGPPSAAFEGLVDSSPYITSDEASGAGNPACPSPSEFGASAPEGHASARTSDGWPQSTLGGEGLEVLAEAIRDARAAIRANPLGSGAAQLVRELYALQRLDHDDVLGERAATLELLAELRGRLSLPQLPAGAREPAEAALSLEISEALLREDYSSAAGLVSEPGRRVEGSEVRRRLRYAELTLDLQSRRFGSALARVDSLVADLPVGALGERRSLLDRAAVIAERQHDALGRSVAPASMASTSSASAHAVQLRLGPAVPNPARGATSLRLDLPQAAAVRADVYDLLGRHVAMLIDGDLIAGSHTLRVEGNRFAPGVYIIRATVSRHGTLRTLTQRLTLVR